MTRIAALALTVTIFSVAGCDYLKPREETINPEKSKVAQPVAASPSTAKEIIIDNNDPGFKSTGDWTSANGGSDFHDEVIWTAGDSAQASASAVWTPEIKVAGKYDVYEWHGEDPNSDHATDAPFTIKYDGGSATVPVDLKMNTGKWHLLGTYKFAAGTSGSITLTNKANGNVIADAIKLVPAK